MATTIQLLRSDVPQQRPAPSVLANAVPMVNVHEAEPGLFFAARDGSLFKVGPASVGDFQPNLSPQGITGNCLGELWVDTSGANPDLKFFNGTEFKSAFTVPALTENDIPLLDASKINSGTFASDRIQSLSISTDKLEDGAVKDAKVSPSAAISSTKLAFSQPGGSVKIVHGNVPLPGPGTGITSSVQDRLGEHISLLDFIAEDERAAIRNGTSEYDATEDVQRAINACQATGLPLYVPVGKYNIESVTAARAVNIYGDSSQNYRGPTPNADYDEDKQSVTTNIGSWFNGTDPTKDVLIVRSTYQKAAGWVCENLQITGGRHGILTHHITYPTRLDNLWIRGQTEACIRAGSNAFGWNITNCRFDSGRFGVVFAGTGPGFNIQLDVSNTNISGQLCSLYNCWFDNQGQAAIYLKQSEGVSIIGGYFERIGKNSTVGWQQGTSYSAGDYVIRGDQECMRCVTGGTSGTSEPTTTKYKPFDGSGGNGLSVNPTETDGGVVWEILGQSAAVLVQDSRGFRLISTQGERNYRVPAVCLLGRASHSYAAIISNNNFREHFPAPGIKAVPDPNSWEAAERVILDGNFISDTGPYYRIDDNGTARGWIISNNIYQSPPSLGSGASLEDSNIFNNINQPGNTNQGYSFQFLPNNISNTTIVSTPANLQPLSANRTGGGVVFSGGTSPSGSSQVSKIEINDDITATATESTIFTLSGQGANLVTVTGSFDDSGTLRRFSDLLFFTWGASPTVISSDGTNTPSSRTYVMANNDQLRLTMGSGSYSVRVSSLGTNFAA